MINKNYRFLGIVVGILLSGIFFKIVSAATAGIPISVPSATTTGYMLTSDATGRYVGTTTAPAHFGTVFATSTTATSTFIFGLETGRLNVGTSTASATSTFWNGLQLVGGCFKDALGSCLTAGAPSDATYITQTANGTLSAEQALSVLSTGIMRVANSTGVITSLTDSAGIAANISDETGSGLLTFATTPTFTTNITAPLVIGGTGAGSTLTFKSTSGVGSSDAIIFQVGNNGATEAGRFTTAGNLGIGTTDPKQVLTVIGNGLFSSDLFINGNDINLGTGTATSTLSGGFGIGVGTTTPGAAFAVATSTAGLNTAFLLSNLGTGYTMWAEDSANDTTPFVIQADGNVGIGTTSPSATLSVQNTSATAPKLLIATTTATTAVLIDSNGNVGIATTTAPSSLTIRGGAFTEEITLVSAATVGVDFKKGNYFRITADAAVTFTFINGQYGGSYGIVFCQDATGGRTAIWPASSTVRWSSSGNVPPSLATKAGRCNVISIKSTQGTSTPLYFMAATGGTDGF